MTHRSDKGVELLGSPTDSHPVEGKNVVFQTLPDWDVVAVPFERTPRQCLHASALGHEIYDCDRANGRSYHHGVFPP